VSTRHASRRSRRDGCGSCQRLHPWTAREKMTTTQHSFETAPVLIGNLRKYQHTASFVGLVFLALTIAGFFLPVSAGAGPVQFMRSFLVGYWFWLGTGGGC